MSKQTNHPSPVPISETLRAVLGLIVTKGEFSKRPAVPLQRLPVPADVPADMNLTSLRVPFDLMSNLDGPCAPTPTDHFARKLAGRLVVLGELPAGLHGFEERVPEVHEWLLDVQRNLFPITAILADEAYEALQLSPPATIRARLRARSRKGYDPLAMVCRCRRSVRLELKKTGEDVVGVTYDPLRGRAWAEVQHPWTPADDDDGASVTCKPADDTWTVGGCGDRLWCTACGGLKLREDRRVVLAGITAALARYRNLTGTHNIWTPKETDRYFAPHVRAGSFEPLSRLQGNSLWRQWHWVLTAPHSGFAPLDAERLDIAFNLFMRRVRYFLEREYGFLATVHPIPYVRVWECTTGRDGRGHPHIHMWILSPEIDREFLRHLWGKALMDAAVEMAKVVALHLDLTQVLPPVPTMGLEEVLAQTRDAGRREQLKVLLVDRTKHTRPPLAAIYQGGIDSRAAGDGVEAEIVKPRYLPFTWDGALVPAPLFADLLLALTGRDRVRGSHGMLKKPDPRQDWKGRDGNVGPARGGRRQ